MILAEILALAAPLLLNHYDLQVMVAAKVGIFAAQASALAKGWSDGEHAICRLVNKSGLRLTYWSVSGSGQGSAYALNAWEESPLMVEPVQKPVILTDTQQQVKHY